ncbi:ABC transporter ATP-binding protein [Aquibacillus sediminis]|uniref:ATP-binding cassette domain-containing protein n=1 Tax=Aquibacillus sediminis TaxID=2574734 RepID=UPI0011095EB3|nr:ABC transporter ATP-binding protein [Aquibacillus sediminis]
MRINRASHKQEEGTHFRSSRLLEVTDFALSFTTYTGGLKETTEQAIKKLDMTIDTGEIVAVVGASGSGKSLLANAILGMLPANATVSGLIKYKGKALTLQDQVQLRGTEIAMIPQSVNSLDPLMKAGKQVRTMIKGKNKKEKQREIFAAVGLDEKVERNYPFQLSGGMARRVLIAIAMVSSAELIVADEPTPGLDEQALEDSIRPIRLLADQGKGVMFITHDIGTALRLADKIVVFNDGKTIETANVKDFYGKGEALRHPYTKQLWNALPQNGFHTP